MLGLSGSELLFYGGIVLMIVSIIAAIICTVIFRYTGQKLKKKLELEYGMDNIKNYKKAKGE